MIWALIHNEPAGIIGVFTVQMGNSTSQFWGKVAESTRKDGKNHLLAQLCSGTPHGPIIPVGLAVRLQVFEVGGDHPPSEDHWNNSGIFLRNSLGGNHWD